STCNSWPTVLLRVPQPRFMASVNSSYTRFARRIGTPTSRPRPTASPTSLCNRRNAKSAGSCLPCRNPVEGAHPAGRTLPHRLPQLKRLDPGLDPHRKDLGERHAHHCTGAIVHELGDGAGADRADIGRLVAHRVEHRLVAVEDLLVAAGPDRHLAAGSTPGAAADRRVENVE